MGGRHALDGGARLARAQGAFNVLNGVWPLVHRRSFEAVTGPKADYWLVRTVAGLLLVNGVAQLRAAAAADGVADARRIGIGTAATLGLVDLAYAPSGKISRVYLVDAAVEAAWVVAWLRRGSRG